MNPMTTPPLDLPAERLTELRDIANAATDGPWEPADDDGWIGGPRCFIVSSDEDSINDAGRPIKVAYRSPGDAAHIAAFDPPTALALLDRLEAAERDLAAVTVSRDGWQTRAEAAEKKVAAVEAAIADIDATIAEAPPANYEEDNYDAGYVHGLVEARDILTPETETTP